MQKLNLPEYDFIYKTIDSEIHIFDIIRKKNVMLTPEEWVRQNFLMFLINAKQFPKSLIAVEKSIKYNTLTKRFDILIHDNYGKPLIIVECKAPHIDITQDVFDQIARYNMVLKVEHLIVTNGLKHFYCQINYENNSCIFIPEIPNYKDISSC